MELTLVTIPGDDSRGDRPSPAVAALAKGATRGMVVIHEIFGRQPEIDRAALRFAEAGYAVVAPDLFHEGKLRCIRALMQSMQRAEDTAPLRQASRARDWLCAQSGIASNKVGLIGFCFGGMFALAAGRNFGAVSCNYGEVSATEAMRGIGKVIACYGGRDRSMRGRGELLRKRLEPLGVTPEVLFYPDAGHSFLTDGHHPVASALSWPFMHIAFHEPSANDAWPKIMDFFARSL
ncbi:MAG: dienelactone hydrolase family protein [Polyangiales bacterium]